jgi:hypothetical protein
MQLYFITFIFAFFARNSLSRNSLLEEVSGRKITSFRISQKSKLCEMSLRLLANRLVAAAAAAAARLQVWPPQQQLVILLRKTTFPVCAPLQE